MPNIRRLLARKFVPGLLSGKIDAADLADNVTEDIASEIAENTTPGAVADGSITPDKLDRSYIEASFGADAEDQPSGILRKIIRLWMQDDKVYGESDDEF